MHLDKKETFCILISDVMVINCLIGFPMQKLIKLIMIVAIVGLTVQAADIPELLSYQGRVYDVLDEPIADGDHTVVFTLFNAETSGSSLWTETATVQTQNGLFSHLIGSVNPTGNPLTSFHFNANAELYVEINVDGETIAPRTALTSSAYSMKSDNANNAFLLNSQLPSYYLDMNNLTNVPPGFADGVDNEGVTEVVAGEGLYGGGSSGTVLLDIGVGAGLALNGSFVYIASNSLTAEELAPSSVGTSEIADGAIGVADIGNNAVGSAEIVDESITTADIENGSIYSADIATSAGISVTKIAGTAVNLTSTQTITGIKTFNDLNIETTDRYLSIPAIAFVPTSTSTGGWRSSDGNILMMAGSPTAALWSAPVNLPGGAEVQMLASSYLDPNPLGEVWLYLERYHLGTWTKETLFSVGSVDGSGINVAGSYPLPGMDTIIDNEMYFYRVVVLLRTNHLSGVEQFAGARIDYTITKPLP